MPKVFNLLSPRTPWRLFLYFVNNLKTVGCYCGVCRRCGFLLREFMVPKTEGRMSDRPPLAVRRTDMKHPQLQRSSRAYRWNMQEYFISRL